MDYSFFQQQTNSYPSVYKIQLDHPNELLALYSSVILANTPVSKVESELADYVTDYIEPTGWKAIWRASPRFSGLSFKCDFLVNVVDVIRSRLDAVIVIEKPLSVQLNELPDDDPEKLERAYLKSAIIIENVRFFMKFIWRPWDTIANETQLNEIFVETRLESRLNLYFDVQNCLLNQTHIKRIKHILTDGWKLRHQLDDIARKQELTVSQEDDDNEYEIDELDMSEAIRLRIKLEDYDREMRMIEDPYQRPFTFYLKVDEEQEEESKEATDKMDAKLIIHIVAKSLNLNSLQMINSHYGADESCSNFELKFHDSLKNAVKAARSGHRIGILPGQYAYESIPWIECDLAIEGLTENSDDVVIESSAFVDVFIHCANNLTLEKFDPEMCGPRSRHSRRFRIVSKSEEAEDEQIASDA
ncbi:hypothetical protein L1887_61444 [Cichorium endivia]|nr:hypothetical protein L1887_61444 [Cichorium endivia]